jgi:hypothetical protein
MENVVIFYDHLEYFTAIWHNVWPFGIVSCHLVYFSRIGMFGPRKIWQPWVLSGEPFVAASFVARVSAICMQHVFKPI